MRWLVKNKENDFCDQTILDDWLAYEPKPEPTKNDIQLAWAKLMKQTLKGKEISLANIGGDMFRIDAIIVQVLPILGVGVLFKIKNATITQEGEGSEKDKLESESLPDANYIFLDDLTIPPVFWKTYITLPAGGECVDSTWKWSFGGDLGIGFIYL